MAKKTRIKLELEIEVKGDQTDKPRLMNRFVKVKHGGKVLKSTEEVLEVYDYDDPKRRKSLHAVALMKAVALEGVKSAGMKAEDFQITGSAIWIGKDLRGADLLIRNQDLENYWSGEESQHEYGTYCHLLMRHRKERIKFYLQPASEIDHQKLRLEEIYHLGDPNLMREIGDVLLAFVRYCENEEDIIAAEI